MARKPRILCPGALYHVVLRGNASQTIFFDDTDRTRFCLLLQEGIERFKHRVHAFCLMSNHVHLAIQMGPVPLSRILQNLSFRYTRWVNWRQNRSGHLFQGRYRAVLVSSDSYLLALTRYIHLNPVRAGIVKTPDDFEWSGHRAYLGLETIPWLSTDWVLSHFSKKVSVARKAYQRFVHDGMKESHQEQYHRGSGIDGRILGDDDFVEQVLGEKSKKAKRKKTLEQIMLEVCKYFDLDKKDFFASGKDRQVSVARAMAGWLSLELGVGTLSELSRRTGRDVTTLSAGVKRLQNRSKADSELADAMNSLLKVVS